MRKILCFLGLHAWRMQKQPFLECCVWCSKEKARLFFPLKSNVPSLSFPKDEHSEALAAVKHKHWSHWMRCLFTKGVQNPDGTFTIEAESVARWQRRMHTPYKELSEAEKVLYRDVKKH